VTAVDAPTKPQFKVEWTDDDAAWVVLLPTDSDTLKPVKIGTIGFNGREWFFWRIDPDGEVVMDTGHFIDVDPDQRMEIHNLTADAEKEIDDAVKEAKRAAAKAKAAMYRDEQKELVVLAAHVHARRWLPLFLQLQSGCTGWFDKDGTVSHDGHLPRPRERTPRRSGGGGPCPSPSPQRVSADRGEAVARARPSSTPHLRRAMLHF
jgi:hypothetical protein